MFGKGVYFADLVSKSAQYCFVKKDDPVGLMLLSEVAWERSANSRKPRTWIILQKGSTQPKDWARLFLWKLSLSSGEMSPSLVGSRFRLLFEHRSSCTMSTSSIIPPR
ncbi:Poly [ADP-ribose] polymerase 1 [Platanthera guangdongensis]|uniref:Poly [ADP-ribose] polymerase n=1 Tax=Platanthera guangdongensis TaxID=2320717 RepID=A0ABR2LZE3_9ASPA